jgi:hypothetical protein
MLASRSVVSVLLRALGDFSLHPQGRPCGRPPAAAVPGRQPAPAARAARKWRYLLGSCAQRCAGSETPRRLLGVLGGAVAFGLGAFALFFGEPVAEVAVLDEGGQGVEDHAGAEQGGHLGGVVGG